MSLPPIFQFFSIVATELTARFTGILSGLAVWAEIAVSQVE